MGGSSSSSHGATAQRMGLERQHQLELAKLQHEADKRRLDYEEAARARAHQLELERLRLEAQKNEEVERLKAQFEAKNKENLDQIKQLQVELQNVKIQQPEDLGKAKKFIFDKLVEVVKTIQPVKFHGVSSVSFIGPTSVGKSSLLNVIGNQYGKNFNAKTGRGDTTKNFESYVLNDKVMLWDFPGKNDEMTYFKTDYIALLKAMDTNYVLYENTIKQNMELLDFLKRTGCSYNIVLTKSDTWPEDELADEKLIARRIIEEKGLNTTLIVTSAKVPGGLNGLLASMKEKIGVDKLH